MSDPRETKLPRWAQNLLHVERLRAKKAESRLAAHLETVEPTRIWYGEYQNKIYVPESYGYQTVYFRVGPGNSMRDEIGVRIKGDGLEVMAGSAASLELSASNVFQVKLRDR